MKKLILSATLVSAIILGACSDEETTPEKSESIEELDKKEEVEVVEETKTWNELLEEIINSSDAPSDKFYALEKVMMDAEVTEAEVETFKQDILTVYKEKTYLADPTK